MTEVEFLQECRQKNVLVRSARNANDRDFDAALSLFLTLLQKGFVTRSGPDHVNKQDRLNRIAMFQAKLTPAGEARLSELLAKPE